MAQLPRPDLHDEIDVRFPDNTSELITPPIVRAFLHNLVDSALLLASDKVDAYSKAAIEAMLAGLRDGLQDVPAITRDEAIAKMQPNKGLLLPRYVVLGLWNGKPAGVALMAATKGLFNPFGLIGSGNDAVAVLADVRAGTYVLLSDLLPKAVGTGTGRNVTFELERHWPVITTGTYVVEATGAQVDVCFQLLLAQGCDEIKIPTTGFEKVSPGLFDSASRNTYWFCVGVNGVVQYAISQPY